MYRSFMERLRQSKGCSQNRDIMIELLAEIQKVPDGSDKLGEFLGKHYPHVIDGPAPQQAAPVVAPQQAAPVVAPQQGRDPGPVFPYFNPGILTYPRRQILEGADLQRRAQEFCLGKIRSDFVVVGGKAYVEYLERGDAAVAASVPQKNWLVTAWRLRNGS